MVIRCGYEESGQSQVLFVRIVGKQRFDQRGSLKVGIGRKAVH